MVNYLKRLFLPKYSDAYACKACEVKLTYSEMMYSNGVCPKCGAVTNGTIVDCVKSSVRNW